MSDSYSDDDFQTRSGADTEDVDNYQKLELREHILTRPENYIGSKSSHTEELWVVEDDKLVQKNITYVPGLYKIFDEILVNAADNCQRDPPTKKIQVEINPEEGFISVWNDGKGIPIQQKYDEKDEKSYWVPEFIFGHLLTSSNYDDSKKRTTGGRNGFGAKLANIYSKRFIVDCTSTSGNSDDDKYYHYVQNFTNHMENIEEPVIKELKSGKKSSTMIKFYPDCALFNMERLDDDIVSLFKKRVWDMAGVLKNCQVILNGEKIPIKGFDDYCKKYLKDNVDFISMDVNDRWKIGVAASYDGFQQVSFVNSVATTRGGTHVDYVANQITKYVCSKLDKTKNDTGIKPKLAKESLFVFVNCLIENPSFDSQTKETLTLKQSEFGSKCEIPETFMKKIMKTDIPNLIKEIARNKQNLTMKKMGGRKTARIHGIEKLVDANEAGKAKSNKCTLILTEGDSAKTMAVTGLSVIGRDFYGVFPLRGKLLNTRDVSGKKLQANEEIQNLMKIMALKPGAKYDDDDSLKDLRYGSIMIMADQDQDGSHIKGLIINFIHSMWPELIKRRGFLCEFITPIVKVFKKDKDPAKKPKGGTAFYTLPEFIEWKRAHDDARGYTVKYYKGLATSNDDETKEYFSDFKRHRIGFEFSGENDEERIRLAFSKKLANQRKVWLAGLDPETTYLGQDKPTITYSDFVDKELILFSNYANVRAIPSVIDGLKPGQRKVLWVSLKQNIRRELKVNQLAGKVSQIAAYHHGENSLSETIVGMAQTFVGSNNINLFYPSGQYGTRLHGGSDAGSSRYIYTRLSDITRYIFHKDDDQLLEYLTDEGIPIEPKYYVPIIPMVLVNGSNGIGVGWSSSVPCYNPRDIIKNIRHKIKGEEMEEMTPWYSGFIGDIVRADKGDEEAKKWNVSGIIKIVTEEMIEITELPLFVWTDEYKQFLDNLFTGENEKKANDKKKKKGADDDAPSAKFEPKISDLKEYHTNETVDFEIYVNSEQMNHIKSVGLDKFFKMTKSIAATNMTLFSPDGHITQYKSAEEIIDAFYPVRLSLYEARKESILQDLGNVCKKLSNQARFIKEFIEGQLELRNVPRKAILQSLKDRGYDPIEEGSKKPKKVAEDAVVVEENEEEDTNEPEILAKRKKAAESVEDAAVEKMSKNYNYLLSMKIWSLTHERYQKLLQDYQLAQEDIAGVEAKLPSDMWLEDLDELEKKYIEFQAERDHKRAENMRDAANSKKNSRSKINIAKTKPRAKKEVKNEFDKAAGDSRSDIDSQVDEANGSADVKPAKPPKKKAADGQRKPRVTKTKKEDGEKPQRKPRATKAKKDDGDSTTDTETVSKPKPKKGGNSMFQSSQEDEDDVIELESDDDSDGGAVESSIIANRSPRRPKKTTKKSDYSDHDDDDDDEDDDDIEDDDDDFEED